MRTILLLLSLLISFSGPEDIQRPLHSHVHLTGKQSFIIVRNSTPDTLQLRGSYFSFLTYSDTRFSISIPPAKEDSIVVNLAYPDFIHVEHLRVFNSPGKTVKVNVLKSGLGYDDISFTNDLSVENNYYLAYQKHFRGFDHESRPYYERGDRLHDFNGFPEIADSIHNQNISFLSNYKKPLPAWFKDYEWWRLQYNNGFRRYHVLFDKEFKTGKKIMVGNAYYDFEKQLPINNKHAILSNDYLWYAMFNIRRHSLNLNEPISKGDTMLFVIDSLYGKEAIGDVLKIKRLLDMTRESKADFENALQTTTFQGPASKDVVASLIYSKVGLPAVGKRSPTLTLKNINDQEVTLSGIADGVIILNFWASWCAPCIKEFPFENKLYNEYKDKGITIVNVCVETDKAKWKQITKAKNLQMVNLFLEPQEYEAAKRHFDLTALPKSIVLDKNLVVRDNHFKRASQITAADMKQLINTH